MLVSAKCINASALNILTNTECAGILFKGIQMTLFKVLKNAEAAIQCFECPTCDLRVHTV